MVEKTLKELMDKCETELVAAIHCDHGGWALMNSVQALLWGLKNCVGVLDAALAPENFTLKNAGSVVGIDESMLRAHTGLGGSAPIPGGSAPDLQIRRAVPPSEGDATSCPGTADHQVGEGI